MLSWVFGLKGLAIASLVSAAVGLGGGWYARDKFCDAKEAKQALAHANATVEYLTNRINTLQRASTADAMQSVADAKRIAELQAAIDAIPANDGACLDEKAAERLRAIR